MVDSAGQAGASDSRAKVVEFPRCCDSAARGYDVERINQFEFYSLSMDLQKIVALGVDGSMPAADALWPVFGAHNAITAILAGKPIELGVSRAKAQALADQLKAMLDRYFMTGGQLSLPMEGAEIHRYEFAMLRSALTEFETVFAEEMREAATYRVPGRGIYNIAKLVDAAQCTFPEELAAFVPQKSQDEWQQAGRCMAFGLFTACGFHVARSVEGALEAYAGTFGGALKRNPSWGDYLSAVEKPSPGQAAAEARTLAELRQLKDDWRNPLMHPRVVLGEPDARAVFNNGETLIMLMAMELKAAGMASPPALALVGSSE